MFEWHRQVMNELLTHFRNNHSGVPYLIDEETWNNIIDQMSLALSEMGDGVDYRAREHAKKRFFRLFSEYYFYLWD